MALTLEPGLRTTGEAYLNITMEDFMDVVDRVEPEVTPMYSMAATEKELGNTEFSWSVDLWPTRQGAKGVADGEDVASGSVRNIVANQRKMGNIGQAFREPFGAGWIASKVPSVAGRGRGKLIQDAEADAYVLLKEDIEAAFCSTDQTAVQDTGSGTGALGAGLRKMIDFANKYTAASTFAYGKPTDLHYAATAAFVTGASMSTTFNLSSVRSVSKALRQAAQSNGDYTFLCGLDLREQVTFLTDPTAATASATGGALSAAGSQVRMYSQQVSDAELGISIDVIRTDWGRWMVVPTRGIGTTTTDSTGGAIANTADRTNRVFLENAKAGYLLKKGMYAKRWGVPMYKQPLPNNGGGQNYDAKCHVGLVVYNPQYFGGYVFTG